MSIEWTAWSVCAAHDGHYDKLQAASAGYHHVSDGGPYYGLQKLPQFMTFNTADFEWTVWSVYYIPPEWKVRSVYYIRYAVDAWGDNQLLTG